MQLLTGADAFQLYAESPVQPMHTLKVVLLDPAGARRAATVDGMAEWLQSAVTRVRPLRWRLVTAPLHFGGYGWVEDASIDVTAHLHQARLEAPGDRTALDDFCGRLMGERLDRDRPLWELWVVDGLADGRIAHVWKQHHALADGLSSVRLMDEIYQHAANEDAPSATPLPAAGPVADPGRRRGRIAPAWPAGGQLPPAADALAAGPIGGGVPSPGRTARLGPQPHRPGHPLQYRPDQPALLHVGDAATGRPEVGGQGVQHHAERRVRRRGGRCPSYPSGRAGRAARHAADRDAAGVHPHPRRGVGVRQPGRCLVSPVTHQRGRPGRAVEGRAHQHPRRPRDGDRERRASAAHRVAAVLTAVPARST